MGASSNNVSKINNNLLNIIIWIDPNINNNENTKYIKDLESFKNTRIYPFKDISDSLEKIKTIKFEDTHIIVSGSLYSEFIKKLEENIRDIYVVPKIIIFTLNKERFLDLNKDYKENSFYSLGGIETSFDKIKSFIFNPQNRKDIEQENSLTFEYIDCKEKLILPLFYKSKFYEDINKDLKDNKKDNYYNSYYMPYVKILYEGIKLKSLKLASNNILYRGGKISLEEIIKIKGYLKNKLKDLPGAIVFSKSFLSFTKSEMTARNYMNKASKNKNKICSKYYIQLKKMIILIMIYLHILIQKIFRDILKKEKYYFYLFHLLK